MRAGLMVIDMQRAFMEGPAAGSLASAAEYVGAVMPAFRRLGLPILWVSHREPDSGLVAGAPGFAWMDGLGPQAGDLSFVKETGSPFIEPKALEAVRALGLDALVLAGYCAEHCVLATYKHAKDLGLKPALLRGGLASESRENIGFVESICDLYSYRALLYAIGA